MPILVSVKHVDSQARRLGGVIPILASDNLDLAGCKKLAAEDDG